MTFLLQHFADEPVAMRTKVAMINDHIFPNLTTSPYNFDETGDLSAVREGCEPGSRQLKGQASDQRVNRGLASNDHPGSFAGQWAGRSILPGDADQGRTATQGGSPHNGKRWTRDITILRLPKPGEMVTFYWQEPVEGRARMTIQWSPLPGRL